MSFENFYSSKHKGPDKKAKKNNETFDKKALKVKGRALAPFTSIGKNGISENTITQIKTHLKAHKLSKIKILRTYLEESGRDKKEVAQELAEKTGSELVELMGLTVTLYKR